MGARGAGWVWVQAALLAVFFLVPESVVRWPNGTVFRLLGAVLAAAGVLLLALGALNLGRSLTPFPRPLEQGQLVTGGAYRFVRHPIYFAVLLACLGFSLMTFNSARLLLTLVLFVFFDLKARREEEWLLEKYPDYAAYRRRVKKLIPWVY